jgi:hypothetical protein
MHKIRTDQLVINAGMTAKGEPRPTSYPVDVWADENTATNNIFNGEGVPQGGQPRSDGTVPPREPDSRQSFPDATFKP